MGIDDKFDDKKDEWVGKAKEKTGEVTNDKDLEREGKLDQIKSDLEQAGEKVKDALKH